MLRCVFFGLCVLATTVLAGQIACGQEPASEDAGPAMGAIATPTDQPGLLAPAGCPRYTPWRLGIVPAPQPCGRGPISRWLHKHPCHCYADIDDVRCTSLKAECGFIFGSCRKFYGEPCRKGPLPPPVLLYEPGAAPVYAGWPEARSDAVERTASPRDVP
jgi:hypothetical protein